MIGLVKTDKTDLYEKYHELLLKKAEVQKECYYYQLRYIYVFGEIIYKLYEIEVDCIILKKKIAFCIMQKNKGLLIDEVELDDFIENEIKQYKTKLDEMLEERKNIVKSFNAEPLSDKVMKEIKKLYYEIAKAIHPDINPAFASDKTILEFFNRANFYYQNNQKEPLEELKDEIALYLSKQSISEIKIENIEEKIRKVEIEIDSLYKNIPYIYKYDLESLDAKDRKFKMFAEKIEEYKRYKEVLEEEVKQFVITRIVN